EVITGPAVECHRRSDRVGRDVDGAVSHSREADEVEDVSEPDGGSIEVGRGEDVTVRRVHRGAGSGLISLPSRCVEWGVDRGLQRQRGAWTPAVGEWEGHGVDVVGGPQLWARRFPAGTENRAESAYALAQRGGGGRWGGGRTRAHDPRRRWARALAER